MSTGIDPGHLRGAWAQVEGHWAWYRKRWYTTVFSSILAPVLFLVALGIGFGSQVRAGAVTGGHPYLVWIAPAMLVTGALQNAAGESSWPVLSGFKWQKNFLAVAATPVTPAALFTGLQLWAFARVVGSAVIFLAIAAAIGATDSAAVLASIPVAALTGAACSGLIMALAASVYKEGNQFNVLFRFVIVPMTLFSGTFFPVSSLPGFLRPLAWVTPLYHGAALARAATFGTGPLGVALGHLGYLVALFALGMWLGVRQFRRRLVV